MMKLKRSEQFSEEREREIKQVSAGIEFKTNLLVPV